MALFRYSTIVRCSMVAIVTAISIGCAPGPPIVANPREPWEDEAERAMLRSFETPTPLPYQEQQYADKGAERREEPMRSGVTTALADIIGFPFRAVGWLAHVLL